MSHICQPIIWRLSDDWLMYIKRSLTTVICSDLPMKRGIITNRNKFVFGLSGQKIMEITFAILYKKQYFRAC